VSLDSFTLSRQPCPRRLDSDERRRLKRRRLRHFGSLSIQSDPLGLVSDRLCLDRASQTRLGAPLSTESDPRTLDRSPPSSLCCAETTSSGADSKQSDAGCLDGRTVSSENVGPSLESVILSTQKRSVSIDRGTFWIESDRLSLERARFSFHCRALSRRRRRPCRVRHPLISSTAGGSACIAREGSPRPRRSGSRSEGRM
jgi:hypothetical protein